MQINVVLTGMNMLSCPGCKDVFLHHSTVEVFDRAEDAPEVRRSHIARGEAVVIERIDNEGSANPSRRRDAVRIKFWCEGCDLTFWLNVSQHKGSSLIEWSKE